MAISLVAVGAKITAAITNAIIGVVNAQGLTSVIPTSVAGTGVSVGAAGKVTFTAATAVSVNGCFTSTYDNYRVVIEVPTVSATVTLTGVLRAAGTDATAANYDLEVLQGTSATAAAAQAAAAASWGLNGGVTGTIHDITLEIKKPFVAAPTYGTAFSMVTQNPQTAPGVAVRGISHRLSTSYDGFTITPTGGTITGTIRIYGYNNC